MPLPLPVLISEGFGTSDSGKTYPIPVPSQIGITNGAASFTDGFPPLTRTPLGSGGVPPSGEDMNGILYMTTAHLALLCSGQPYKYDSGQATAIGGYDVGATLLRADGSGFWLNTLSGNTSDPETGGAGWVPGFNYGSTTVTATTGTATLSLAQVSKRVIIVNGALSGNTLAVFPAGIQGVWVVANDTSNSFTLTAQVAGGTNVVSIPQAGPNAPTIVYSDGTDLWNANVSTAGLAPINSPNLTGTPTAPTASATSNTTQIATTAQVRSAILAAIAGLAPLASPTFSGVPTAPTPSPGDNSTKLATTAFVDAAIGASILGLLAPTGYMLLPNGLKIKWGTTLCNNTQVIFPGAGAYAFTANPYHIGLQLQGVASSANVQVGNGLSGIPAPTPTSFYACGGNVTVFWWAFGV